MKDKISMPKTIIYKFSSGKVVNVIDGKFSSVENYYHHFNDFLTMKNDNVFLVFKQNEKESLEHDVLFFEQIAEVKFQDLYIFKFLYESHWDNPQS